MSSTHTIYRHPNPAMPLQPRTPRTDSFLGSDSRSRLQHLPTLDLPFPHLPHLPGEYERHPSSRIASLLPPSTSTWIWRPSTAPPCIPSQQSLSRPTPTTIPYVDWTTRSLTQLDSSPLGLPTLQPSPYSIPIPSTQLLPSSTPHYPPECFSRTVTPTRVGGAPPSILEDPDKLEKALRAVSGPAYLMLSISAALLNINAFSTNSITKIPLMIATTTSFFAVMIHWMATLQLHVSQSVHHIKRPLVLFVTFLAVSIFATLFALPAHSWSQEECNPYCWVERSLVSTVVIGGFASLMIGGWRMRGGDGWLAARVDWS